MDENPPFFLSGKYRYFVEYLSNSKFSMSPKTGNGTYLVSKTSSCRDFKIHGFANIVRIKQEFLEFSLYKSSRVVPRVTLAPFLESQVQNLKKRFFASFAMFSGEKLVACSEFFFFQFSSDFSTRGTK